MKNVTTDVKRSSDVSLNVEGSAEVSVKGKVSGHLKLEFKRLTGAVCLGIAALGAGSMP